ncbi:phenylacetone monooxygenase [Pyrenophora seminiperda CCB06]|uniref:Phenylacetone monooxygenase n=1 Tax=Pyrenophora seminiperda CCB06 TaxID=1302712 RepID=A0A3M7M0C8_9PLEO|nr:phenylacetone monooxygenase [Pyrenophora seminiperda CCB06]
MAVTDPANLQARYAQERDKRLRADGMQQYTRLPSEAEKPLSDDPWVGLGQQENGKQEAGPLKDGGEIQFLMIGAGHVGLLAGGRLIQAGFSAKDMCLVDVAGGFGGTWYWNRYPGLQCDIESYIYMPFLEETGYVPKRKYASGDEIRQHCERVAGHFGLRGQFSTRVLSATWDEGRRRWVVRMRKERGDGEGEEMTVYAQFVVPCSTIFTAPRIPRLDGFDELRANIPVFHTARWDYNITGGSPTDDVLSKLKGKRVGVMGTGATAVQVIPHLARWAEHLHVFQRTPSYCGPRRQQPTDEEAFSRDVATGPGWQLARRLNFDTFFDGQERGPDHPDLVGDGWTKLARGFAGFVGGPRLVTPETIEEHTRALYEIDVPLTEQARAHIRNEVKDPKTAERLQPWYPSWCKRPTFQDGYLPAFNQPNVTLVDTDGRGVERCTPRGIVSNGVEYEFDVLVLSTGFLLATGPDAAPAELFGIPVVGRNGRRLKDKYGAADFGTMHGVATNGFPNLLYPGLGGGGGSPNLTTIFDIEATHIANVLKQAVRRVEDPKKLVIEPTKQAEDAWTDEVEKRALWFSAVLACTPGYFNHEGAALTHAAGSSEGRRLTMRRALHGGGMAMYEQIIRKYDASGDIEGFAVS